MKDIKPKRPIIIRLISMLLNGMFWHSIYTRIMQWLFPQWYPVIKLYQKAPDAKLVGLDGKTVKSLVRDYINVERHIPLVLNIGSYNWSLFLAKLSNMSTIHSKYCSGAGAVARFLTVYIEECKWYFQRVVKKRAHWFCALYILVYKAHFILSFYFQ